MIWYNIGGMGRQKILLVDDDRAVRTSLAASLSDAGYDVQCVRSGDEALQAIGESRPDLVLLDVMMPGRDGFSTCAEIRRVIKKNFGAKTARSVSILYGGSMNAANAEKLLSMPDIDGGLIGGASLNPQDFSKIIAATNQE